MLDLFNENSNQNRVRVARLIAGYTQEDMAKVMPITRVGYNQKENGKRKWQLDEKQKVYKMLKKKIPNLKLEDLFPID